MKLDVALPEPYTVETTLKDVAKNLTEHRKRDFMAKVAQDYNDWG